MQQVKFFKTIEADLSETEREINAWLAESGAQVVHMFGNIAPQTAAADPARVSGRAFAPSDIFIALVYVRT